MEQPEDADRKAAQLVKDNGNQLIGKGRYLEAYAEYHKAFAVLERSSHINPVNTYSSRVLLIATIYSNLSLVQLHMKDYLGAFESCMAGMKHLNQARQLPGTVHVSGHSLVENNRLYNERLTPRLLEASEGLRNYAMVYNQLHHQGAAFNFGASNLMQVKAKHDLSLCAFRAGQVLKNVYWPSPQHVAEKVDVPSAAHVKAKVTDLGSKLSNMKCWVGECTTQSGNLAFYGGGGVDGHPCRKTTTADCKFPVEILKFSGNEAQPITVTARIFPKAGQVAPIVRRFARMAVWDNRLYLWGGGLAVYVEGWTGLTPVLELTPIWMLDLKAKTWTQLKRAKGKLQQPSVRLFHTFTACKIDNKPMIIMLGGLESIETGFADALLWTWNISKSSWSLLKEDHSRCQMCDSILNQDTGMYPFESIAGHGAWVYGDSFYVYGGIRSGAVGFLFGKDVWRFDLKRKHWNRVVTSGNAPSPRAYFSVSALEGGRRIIIAGGFTGLSCMDKPFWPDDSEYSSSLVSDVFEFDCESHKWRQVVPEGSKPQWLTARAGASSISNQLDNSVYLLGGWLKEGETCPPPAGPQAVKVDLGDTHCLTNSENGQLWNLKEALYGKEVPASHREEKTAARKDAANAEIGQEKLIPVPASNGLSGQNGLPAQPSAPKTRKKENIVLADESDAQTHQAVAPEVQEDKLWADIRELGGEFANFKITDHAALDRRSLSGPWAVTLKSYDPSKILGGYYTGVRYYVHKAAEPCPCVEEILVVLKLFGTQTAAEEYHGNATLEHCPGSSKQEFKWTDMDSTLRTNVKEMFQNGKYEYEDTASLGIKEENYYQAAFFGVIERAFIKFSIRMRASEDHCYSVTQALRLEVWDRYVYPMVLHHYKRLMMYFNFLQPITPCVYCNRHPRTQPKVCSKCRRVRFCSRECLAAGWKAHKILCKVGEIAEILPVKPLPPTTEEMRANGQTASLDKHLTRFRGVSPKYFLDRLKEMHTAEEMRLYREGFLSELGRAMVDDHPWCIPVTVEAGPNEKAQDQFFLYMHPLNTVKQLKHMVQMGKSPVKVTRLSTTTSLCDIAPQFHEDTVLSMVWPKDKRPDLVPFSYHTSESQS